MKKIQRQTKIITLTLNPAFDLHCYTKEFVACKENIATVTDFDAGGKGVNVSRALQANGIDNISIALLGEENGAAFTAALEKEGLYLQSVCVAGRIRENITIHTENAPETRLSFDGFTATSEALKEIVNRIGEVKDDTLIALTGSLPRGMSIEAVKEVMQEFVRQGAKLIIDSRSFSLSDLVECSPFLIKPNEQEIQTYTGVCPSNEKEAATLAETLRQKGVENVLLSLGARGAVLSCAEGIFYGKAPKIEAISTIGAGDSMIAGFLSAYVQGKTKSEVLKSAIAYGTAACLQKGTKPPLPKDVVAIERQTEIQIING
ncbi:MAG: 1-phosphofructokinase family hexose kinase [Clostridia bacterium]|nr:1-phosphofructokinase family hexose kinase [Clostridia bacterium]